MVTVGLYDTLVLTEESTPEISLRCHDAGYAPRTESNLGNSEQVPDGRDNLAVRAAELLRAETGADRGIHIDLFKRIPAAAGLAGGSSDAAAMLFALNRIWHTGLSRDELQRLASRIGSDVGFFLSPCPTAICQGRGEVIRPLSAPLRLHFVIAKPESGLSTVEVYRYCRPEHTTRGSSSLIESLQRGDLKLAGRRMFNSLQSPAEALNPDVQHLSAAFARLPFVGHMMSGSGTAYFGVCRHRHEAMRAAARLRASGQSRVFVVETPP
jgi:4-diphosphocytidyl-2-C-methyl-D-erythritol kinase